MQPYPSLGTCQRVPKAHLSLQYSAQRWGTQRAMHDDRANLIFSETSAQQRSCMLFARKLQA